MEFGIVIGGMFCLIMGVVIYVMNDTLVAQAVNETTTSALSFVLPLFVLIGLGMIVWGVQA